MGLVISVSEEETPNFSKLSSKIADVCEDVVKSDGCWLFIPQPGKLMALLEILNEEGIGYNFHRSSQNEKQ